MANDKKPTPRPEMTTPFAGFAIWPKLAEPDFGTKEYPKPNGEFNTKLRYTREEAEPLIAMLRDVYAEADEKGKAEYASLDAATRKKKGNDYFLRDLFDEELDDNENPTGNVIFKFKMSHSGVSKKTGKEWSRMLALFDAKGQPIRGAARPRIMSGSMLKINFSAVPNFTLKAGAGVTLYMNAVQIVELSDGTKSAEEYGFGAVDDGFEYTPDEFASAPKAAPAAATKADDDEDDF